MERNEKKTRTVEGAAQFMPDAPEGYVNVVLRMDTETRAFLDAILRTKILGDTLSEVVEHIARAYLLDLHVRNSSAFLIEVGDVKPQAPARKVPGRAAGGKARAAKLSAAQRSAIAKKGGQAKGKKAVRK